jgi:hypothetical protein
MYTRGAIYNSQHIVNLKKFIFKIPYNIKTKLINISNNNSHAKRVNIYNWKAGKTISTQKLSELDPEIIEWYKNFAHTMSNVVKLPLIHTGLELPTSCALLIYDEPGDFINWHYDVNYFDGKFFTVLIPISEAITDTKYYYIDENGVAQSIDQNEGGFIFEGQKVFHMASKLGTNQRRVVLSLQYATDNNINFFNRILMYIKDRTYI